MWPLDVLHDRAWQPLTCTLLHFLWQGMLVAAVWMLLFRVFRGRSTQFRYLLGLFGMFLLAACPLATFAVLESKSEAAKGTVPFLLTQESGQSAVEARAGPALGDRRSGVSPLAEEAAIHNHANNAAGRRVYGRDPTVWIGAAQPYLLGGWILGLVFLSGRLLFGVVGAHRLGRGRLALSGEIADRAKVLAVRLGFRSLPRVFSAKAAREAVVIGLLRPMVLLPVAWLAEMTPEVLEAVIAHELAHIRRFDVWFNLFQRFVETLLFYHPAVWWLSRRVRLAREMCCDELAAAVTGERVVYATALELAARKRLEPAKKSLLEVALGITRMTLLDRVRNVLGLAARHERGRWWPAAVMTLLVLPAVWFASMAATSAQEDKPATEAKPAEKMVDPVRESDKPQATADSLGPANGARRMSDAPAQVHEAVALLRISMQENSTAGGAAVDTDTKKFEIYKNTQAQMLRSRHVLRAVLRNPAVAKLPSVERHRAAGDLISWIESYLHVGFPGDAEIMRVGFYGDTRKEADALLNAIVDVYMNEVVARNKTGRRDVTISWKDSVARKNSNCA